MNATLQAVKLGLERGWIEFKQFLRNPQEIFWALFMTAIFVLVLWFQRKAQVEGVSLAFLSLPSLLGVTVASGGLAGVAGALSYDREDGTLLRAKALPQGMVGYFVSRVVYIVLTTLVNMIILFVPCAFFISGLTGIGFVGLVSFIGLFFLGLLATAPIGAMVGSMVKSSGSGFGLSFMPLLVLGAISGIFYPITSLAGWIQTIAQFFPVYWLAHGMRMAFLPEAAAAAEIGGQWRPELMLAVLGAWAIIGMLFAPRFLRKMARTVSGSEMQARKDQVMQRGY